MSLNQSLAHAIPGLSRFSCNRPLSRPADSVSPTPHFLQREAAPVTQAAGAPGCARLREEQGGRGLESRVLTQPWGERPCQTRGSPPPPQLALLKVPQKPATDARRGFVARASLGLAAAVPDRLLQGGEEPCWTCQNLPGMGASHPPA